jgi:hypothetical protein
MRLWLGQVASLIATASLIPIRARGSSPTRQETPSGRHLPPHHPPDPPPHPGLVQGAAVLNRFRCMACPTETDLERDNTPVVRKSQTAAHRRGT